MTRPSGLRDLPQWLWLWLPLACLALVYGSSALARGFYLRWIAGETGFVELGTSVILLPAIVCGALAFRHRAVLPRAWLAYWVLAFTAGSFYFAGEDLSWGQVLLGWRTPEMFMDINDQFETNLHNISSWFDQKPRMALEIWVVVGGILVPLWAYFRGSGDERGADWRHWFWPTYVVLPSALLAVLTRLPERLADWLDLSVPSQLAVRHSEIQEFFLALFLTLYLSSLYLRLRRARSLRDDAARPIRAHEAK